MSEDRPPRDDAPASTSKDSEVVAAAADRMGSAGEDALVGRTVTINRPRAADPKKSDPADVARDGWDALMDGKASVVSGWKNKIQQAMTNVTTAGILAEQHRKMAEPGSADPEDLVREQAGQ